MRRPRRDAPPAQVRVPTPMPPRRPTRPYLPEGHTRPQRHERLELAYRADAAVFARRAYPHRTPRPGLPCFSRGTASDLIDQPHRAIDFLFQDVEPRAEADDAGVVDRADDHL